MALNTSPNSRRASRLIRRRAFLAGAPATLLAASALPACTGASDTAAYEALAAQIRQEDAALAPGPTLAQNQGKPLAHDLVHELVRCATLAPSSHNTQCWQFALEGQGIRILPDLARRCPAVDPDLHHIFVSLGCAAENLAQAAAAHGLHAEAEFDAARGALRMALAPTAAHASPPLHLYQAIATRQCTRGDYDGQPISSQELKLLEQAGSLPGVRLLLLTERAAQERVLEQVLQANSAQLADAAFIKELKSWIRFNPADALRSRDGLFSATSGSPSVPSWLGELGFGWFFTAKSENEKIVRQMRSSAGLAIFVGEAADHAHWLAVGRAYERFALQATALGIRNAFLNQPVEVAAQRAPFAAALGLAGQRPDLLVRFGRGPTLPASLRRPVEAVLRL